MKALALLLLERGAPVARSALSSSVVVTGGRVTASAVRGFCAPSEGDRDGAASRRSDGPHVGDLPRTRSVQQEQLAADSDHEAAHGRRPAAWPRRSPDAPPDPATRAMGGRDTMPDEQYAQEAARMTIRHGSGKSAEAIMAGPEAAEAAHSNTAVKFVYQQQPSPEDRDAGHVGTTPMGAAEQAARQYEETRGTGSETKRGGPTDDIPELGGFGGAFGPHGEMGSHYSLRQPRQAGSRGAPPEAGGGVRSQSDMQRAGGGKEAGGGGGGECVPGWHIGVAGNGITETVKAGVGRLQEYYQQAFGKGSNSCSDPVAQDRAPDRVGAGPDGPGQPKGEAERGEGGEGREGGGSGAQQRGAKGSMAARGGSRSDGGWNMP